MTSLRRPSTGPSSFQPEFENVIPINRIQLPGAAARPGSLDGKYKPWDRDPLNLFLVDGATLVGPSEIPLLAPCSLVPERLVAFSETSHPSAPADAVVHFYEQDFRFERIWRNPKKYLDRLRRFAGVICPDFSTHRDIPRAQRIEHIYRNFAIGVWLQREGIDVIANVRVDGLDSVSYSLAGVPENSTVAMGTLGCVRSKENRERYREQVRLTCDNKMPKSIVVCGTDAYGIFNYARGRGVEVVVFPPDSRYRSDDRRAAA